MQNEVVILKISAVHIPLIRSSDLVQPFISHVKDLPIEVYTFIPTPNVIYNVTDAWTIIGRVSDITGIVSTLFGVFAWATENKELPTTEVPPQIMVRVENIDPKRYTNQTITINITGKDSLDEQIEQKIKELKLLQTEVDIERTRQELAKLQTPRWRKVK